MARFQDCQLFELWLSRSSTLNSHKDLLWDITYFGDGQAAQPEQPPSCSRCPAATLHVMKPFINSLADAGAGLETSLVIVALDTTAFANCQSMHQPHLCIDASDAAAIPEGTLTNWSPGYFAAGWTRTVWTHKAVKMGFTVLMVDLDLVWFKNPYRYLEAHKEAQVLVTDDCIYDPLLPHNATGKMANLGVVMFRNEPLALKLLEVWLTMRGQEWDQSAFRTALMQVVRDEPNFRPHVMGVQLFVNLCCQYCTTRYDDMDVHQMQQQDIHQCFHDEVHDIYMVHVACTRGATPIESKGHLLTMLLNYRRTSRQQQPQLDSIR
ncbi:hypothetical protein WJX72_007504 [[Myrmecia] bisecta]|uniref:Nucleotide-diphospho-sugar transferase domain-containing protein n=1 Tax=[Myrmecia] bisecta TaxID=41462 RepID=A0AAW1Q5P0_9CHLO